MIWISPLVLSLEMALGFYHCLMGQQSHPLLRILPFWSPESPLENWAGGSTFLWTNFMWHQIFAIQISVQWILSDYLNRYIQLNREPSFHLNRRKLSKIDCWVSCSSGCTVSLSLMVIQTFGEDRHLQKYLMTQARARSYPICSPFIIGHEVQKICQLTLMNCHMSFIRRQDRSQLLDMFLQKRCTCIGL